MTDEQTHNKPNRSAQVEDILDELSQYKISGSLWRKISAILPEIAELADTHERLLVSKRKYWSTRASLEPARTSTQTGSRLEPARTGHIIEKKVSKSKKVYMPIDFSPNQEWARRELSWDGAKAAEEAERFVGYCRAHGKQYADWDQAWRNWCRSPYQQKGNGNGRSKTSREQWGDLLQSLGRGEVRKDAVDVLPNGGSGRSGGVSGNGVARIHELSNGNGAKSGLPVRHTDGQSNVLTDDWGDN